MRACLISAERAEGPRHRICAKRRRWCGCKRKRRSASVRDILQAADLLTALLFVEQVKACRYPFSRQRRSAQSRAAHRQRLCDLHARCVAVRAELDEIGAAADGIEVALKVARQDSARNDDAVMARWPPHDKVRAGAQFAGLLLVDDDVEGERKDLKLLLTDNINRAAARCGRCHRLCRRLAWLLRRGARDSERNDAYADENSARWAHSDHTPASCITLMG